jgi:hypothetical protein
VIAALTGWAALVACVSPAPPPAALVWVPPRSTLHPDVAACAHPLVSRAVVDGRWRSCDLCVGALCALWLAC